MNQAIWIVRVIENNETYDYEYANAAHAVTAWEDEIRKGNKAEIIEDTNY